MIEAYDDNITVEPLDDAFTPGGIALPSNQNRAIQRGKVLSCGRTVGDRDGKHTSFAPDDVVYYFKQSAHELKPGIFVLSLDGVLARDV